MTLIPRPHPPFGNGDVGELPSMGLGPPDQVIQVRERWTDLLVEATPATPLPVLCTICDCIVVAGQSRFVGYFGHSLGSDSNS